MAQVSVCPPLLKRRPDLTPPDLGYYTVDDRSRCMGGGKMNDDVRRKDIGRMRWPNGAPRADMEPSPDGLAQRTERPLRAFATEAGPVELPSGPGSDVTFMPSSYVLDTVFFSDSRRTGISDRYYR